MALLKEGNNMKRLSHEDPRRGVTVVEKDKIPELYRHSKTREQGLRLKKTTVWCIIPTYYALFCHQFRSGV